MTDKMKPDDVNIDNFVTALYRQFKDWQDRKYTADDVAWCEVRAMVVELTEHLPVENKRLEADNQWQPIETAPKGEELLVIDSYGDMHVAEYVGGNGWGASDGGGYHYLDTPTHWMTLPNPPVLVKP